MQSLGLNLQATKTEATAIPECTPATSVTWGLVKTAIREPGSNPWPDTRQVFWSWTSQLPDCKCVIYKLSGLWPLLWKLNGLTVQGHYTHKGEGWQEAPPCDHGCTAEFLFSSWHKQESSWTGSWTEELLLADWLIGTSVGRSWLLIDMERPTAYCEWSHLRHKKGSCHWAVNKQAFL